MIDSIKIEGKFIGKEHPPFIVAEMSGNHNQSLDKALKIVEMAAKAGVSAVKLQTYTADTMTLDINSSDFRINDPNSLWRGESLYKLYEKAYTPWDWHGKIFARCKELGIICFSTPFDEKAVDFLESLNTPIYKIASFENTDIPLIKKVASTGKPLIISTGMGTIAELDELVSAIRESKNNNIVLLKTTSSYPASPEDSNILTIPHMRQLFDCQVGLSDHTLGIGVAIASIALGATIIEKHFTLSRNEGGVDAEFSLEPNEMTSLVTEANNAWKALGKIYYGPTEGETNSKKFRRSLYIVKDINAGEKITNENIRSIRPGYGLPPKYLDIVKGKKVKNDVKKGTPFNWDMLD